MSFINIVRENKDPFYRYKMPPVVSKVEGRGNGIKTAVVNTPDVARALSRPSAYVIKYFGFELGAQTSMNEETNRFLVNGAHDAGKLQDSLDGFISKFVLCASCKNPETDLTIGKDGTIMRDCKACGRHTPVDPRHKLSTYILKNPPSTASKGSKGKKAATASADVGGGANGIVDDDDDDDGESKDTAGAQEEEEDAALDAGSDDELTRQINADAATIRDTGEVTWTVDVSDEAVRARQKQQERSVAVLDMNAGEEEDEEDEAVYNELGEWISKNNPSDVDIYKKAIELQIVHRHHTVQVLAQTLFTDNIVKEIEEHAGLLSKLVSTKNHEKALLGGVERLIGLTYPDKIKDMPTIMFKLYNNDLVSEDTALKWGTKASKKYVDKDTSKKVRKAAKPFIDWLQEAESESESE